MAKDHIATYPIYGSSPMGFVMTNNRIGTGYIFDPKEIPALDERLSARGHPLHIRWRNEECRRTAYSNPDRAANHGIK
jgi:hypothetical protein